MLLIILVIAIGSKVVYKDNFAIIEGTITGPIQSNGSYSKNIKYPEGFNQNNCVVISNCLNLQNDTIIWGTGGTFDSLSYVAGSIPTSVSLRENDMVLRIRHVYIDNTGTVFSMELNGTYDYRIVLMKTGE